MSIRVHPWLNCCFQDEIFLRLTPLGLVSISVHQWLTAFSSFMGMSFHWVPARNERTPQDELNGELHMLPLLSVEKHFCEKTPAYFSASLPFRGRRGRGGGGPSLFDFPSPQRPLVPRKERIPETIRALNS